MTLLFAIHIFVLGVAYWSLRQKSIDREIRKQVGLLALASSFVSILQCLLIFFDFLEATKSGFIVAFISDTALAIHTSILISLSFAHLTVAILSFNLFFRKAPIS